MTLKWAGEAFKALAILKTTSKDYLRKEERAASSFSSDSNILSLKISSLRKRFQNPHNVTHAIKKVRFCENEATNFSPPKFTAPHLVQLTSGIRLTITEEKAVFDSLFISLKKTPPTIILKNP